MKSEHRTLIAEFVEKYAQMLNTDVRPQIVIRDNVNARWLGRTLWRLSAPNNTVMELQRSILEHPKTLERVIAHEMIHHVDLLELTEDEIHKMQRGWRRDGHGPKFHTLSRRVNEQVGDPNFVTEKSDEEYVLAPTTKPYFLLVADLDGHGRYGYAYAVRPSPRIKKTVERKLALGARLLTVTDRRWSTGPRIGEGWAVPVLKEDQAKLAKLFEGAST